MWHEDSEIFDPPDDVDVFVLRVATRMQSSYEAQLAEHSRRKQDERLKERRAEAVLEGENARYFVFFVLLLYLPFLSKKSAPIRRVHSLVEFGSCLLQKVKDGKRIHEIRKKRNGVF